MTAVAVVQLTSVPADVEANVAEHARLIAEAGAQGADVVVFPELSLTGYELGAIAGDPALTLSREDPRLVPLVAACATAGPVAVVGAPVASEGRRLLAALVLDGHGVRDVYGKRHLHESEAGVFAAGDRDVLLDVGGSRLALAVCFDSAHPEHATACRAAGADAYLVGANFAVGEEDRIAERMAARAREGGLWVALAQHAGRAGTWDACGGSGFWAPTGEKVVHLGQESPALGVVELDAHATT